MKIILFANTDWYLYNFRLALAQALRDRGDNVFLVSPPGEYGLKLREMGFRWQPFAFSRRGINPVTETITLIRLKNLYHREQPDLVHHFTIKCVLYGSYIARQVGIQRVVNSITGLGYVFISHQIAARMIRGVVSRWYRIALRDTDVIFQNPEDKQLFLSYHFTDEQHSYLIPGSGVNVKKFFPCEEPSGIPVVVLPARLLWDKGIGEFVEAARMLRAEGIRARFALVGKMDNGNPAAIPISQLTAWQKEEVVEWWGWQEDIAAVYAQASIVCLPSYREGMPRVLAEAGASGRPVVATNVPGCKLVVRDGVNGLLVEPYDARGLADALRRLILDPSLRSMMGKQGREIAIREFSTERVIADTLSLYQRRNL